MKKSFYTIVLLLIASIFFSATPATAQNRVTISTVFQEYNENIVRADQRFDGQTIELVGRVSGNIRSGRNPRTERDEFYVVLVDREHWSGTMTLRAFFPAANRNEVARLDQQQDVVIRGRFSRLDHAGRQFILMNSSVVSIGATADERWAQQQAETARIQQEREREERELNAAPKFVVINGVRWATRNLNSDGTFVSNVEDFGGRFSWQNAQNACPPGWRLPTYQEMQSLRHASSVWIEINRRTGYLIGTMPSRIFLPFSIHGTDYLGASHRLRGGSVVSRGTTIHPTQNYPVGNVRCVTDANTLAELSEMAEQVRIQEEQKILQKQERLRAEEEARHLAEQERLRVVQLAEEERIRQEKEFARQIRELNTSLAGVVINGVRWATRNVDAPGTFADTPEDRGRSFRRNLDNHGNSTWQSSVPERATRASLRNPCPPGWRIPTQSELQSLIEAGSVGATRNGAMGRLFGTYPNQVFLQGNRNVGGSVNVTLRGSYWSSTQGSCLVFSFSGRGWAGELQEIHGYNIGINNSTSQESNYIRCVADN